MIENENLTQGWLCTGVSSLICFLKFIIYFVSQRERASTGEEQRQRERLPSMLLAASTEPHAWLDLKPRRDHDLKARVGRLMDSATQAPLSSFILNKFFDLESVS